MIFFFFFYMNFFLYFHIGPCLPRQQERVLQQKTLLFVKSGNSSSKSKYFFSSHLLPNFLVFLQVGFFHALFWSRFFTAVSNFSLELHGQICNLCIFLNINGLFLKPCPEEMGKTQGLEM